jgi:hypothetical protein
MPTGAGFSSKAAWKKEGSQSAYASPITCGANDQIPFLTEGIEEDIAKEPDNTIRNKAGAGESIITEINNAGPIIIEAVYRGIESLFVSGLGFCHYTNSPALIATGVYKHAIELAELLHTEGWYAGDGILAGSGYLAGDQKVRRATLCFDKKVSIWEFASAMIQAFTLRGESKGVYLDLDLLPYGCDRASIVNPNSNAWSIPNDDWRSILFGDLDCWIGDYSESTPLTSDNAIGISKFEIKLENNLSNDRDSISGLYIAEPKRNAKRRITGSLTIPRYENEAFLDDLDSQAKLMAMFRFTGPQIGSTGYYNTLWVWLPTIKIDKGSVPIGGPALLTKQITFSAELPTGLAAGFPSQATKEMLIQIQNDLNTNPLH